MDNQCLPGSASINLRRYLAVLVLPSAVVFTAVLFRHGSRIDGRTSGFDQRHGERNRLQCFQIDEFASPRDYLLSEARSATSEALHRRKFCVRNQSSDGIEVTIKAPSCTCLRFTIDGHKVRPQQSFSVGPRQAKILHAAFPLPRDAGATAHSFTLAAHRLGQPCGTARATIRTEVFCDLAVEPRRLRFIRDRNGTVDEQSLEVLATTRNSDRPPPPIVEPEGKSGMWSAALQRTHDNPEQIGAGMWRHKYVFSVAVASSDPANGFLAANFILVRARDPQLRAAIVGDDHGSALARARDDLRIPVVLVDSRRLDLVPLLQFGTVPAGATATRSLLVSTHDGGAFAIREIQSCGDGTVVTIDDSWRRKANRMLISMQFSADAPGEHTGSVVFVPESGYEPTEMRYVARVSTP